jgi:hypothetical protein
MIMANQSMSFYDYFKESMDSVGLPAPTSLFNSLQTATANISAMLATITKLGKTATIVEIIITSTGRALAVDVLAALAGVSAAFYVGACVGALAYASGQFLRDNLFASNDGTWQIVHRANALGLIVNQEVVLALAHELPQRNDLSKIA